VGAAPGRPRPVPGTAAPHQGALLLDPQPGYYAAKIAFNLLLLAGGWAALALVGNSWWVIAVGAYMAFAYTQTSA
jgi:hypothetical protein